MHAREVRMFLLFAFVTWASVSLLRSSFFGKSALANEPPIHWYDRVIHFFGALLMASLAAGIVYLWWTGKLRR